MGRFPTHVGIVAGDETFIHSPGKDNTIISVAGIQPERIELAEGAVFLTNPIGYKSPTIALQPGNYRYTQAPL